MDYNKRDKEWYYKMVKVSIQQEDTTLVESYTPHIVVTKYAKQILLGIER